MTRLHRGWLVAVALVAAGACKSSSPSPPTTFGVNITVDARALSADQRTKATVGRLAVTGAETDIQTFSIAGAIGSGELRFRYIPKSAAGSLTFQFQALDFANVSYGSGTSTPVAIGAGAVAASITLTAATGTASGDGATCTSSAQCASGFCSDGVCCHEACDGVCRSCAQQGLEGLCTFYQAGTDPQTECGGFTQTVAAGGAGGHGGNGAAGAAGGHGGAAGSADAGTGSDAAAPDAGEMINNPDGGVMAMPSQCGGTCDGAGACKYADKGTSCGTPFCNNHRDLASITCDGKGMCGISLQTCGNGFGCQLTSSPGACRTSCLVDDECQAGFYCNAGTCAPQKPPGQTCTADGQCGSAHCASGVCCKTACASPNTCDTSGVCKCQNLTCNAGVSCTLWYPDVDIDGFGDRNGTPMIGCADTPPAVGKWVTDNTDCDDHDGNAFPGQTAFFSTTSAGVHTFDYNCDGVVQKGIAEYPGASCTFCPSACSGNGCSDPTSAICASANAQASLACPREGGICPIILNPQPIQTASEIALPLSVASTSASTPIVIQLSCCGCNDHAGFNSPVTCGQNGTYVTCGTCGSSSGTTVGSGTPNSSTTKTQICH